MYTIAIGIGENRNVLEAISIFKTQHSDCNIKLIEKEEDLIKAIKDQDVDAVIRGSLPASSIMKDIKEHYSSNLITRVNAPRA